MTLKLKNYKLPLLILVLASLVFPSLAFSYANIEISDISLAKTNTERLLITWDTNLKTNASVEYGKNRNALSHRQYEEGDATRNHKIEIKDLEDGELYYFQLVSENAVRAVRSKIIERYIDVRTGYHYPISDLAIDNFSKKATSNQGTVSFGTNFPSAGSLVVKRNNLQVSSVNFAYSNNHSATITNLVPGVCYDLYLNLKDKYSSLYSSNYSLCTLRKSVLPKAREGNWVYDNNESAPDGHVSSNGVIVAGIEYERFPRIQALYKTNDSSKIWLIANNQRHLITKPSAFEDYGFVFGDVKTVSWPQIAKYPPVKLVKAPNDSTVYFLHYREDGNVAKIVIPSSTVFDSYNANRREDIVTISKYDIDSYPNVSLVKSISNGYLYYISGNTKHYVSREVASKYIFDESDVLKVNTIHLSRYEAGDGLK